MLKVSGILNKTFINKTFFYNLNFEIISRTNFQAINCNTNYLVITVLTENINFYIFQQVAEMRWLEFAQNFHPKYR